MDPVIPTKQQPLIFSPEVIDLFEALAPTDEEIIHEIMRDNESAETPLDDH